MSNPYIYLFVREDLSKPQQIIQTAHAVDELNKELELDKITATTNYMVLCPAENEMDLYDIAMYLGGKGIQYHMFYEPDIEACTAIATEPLVGDERTPLQVFSTMK